jgi:hypothetical protein
MSCSLPVVSRLSISKVETGRKERSYVRCSYDVSVGVVSICR